MIPKACKRLAEVDFPIAEVSKHAAREKSIRHGHPSTLHLWWARRPLASCRAVLLGLLLPDPCDPLCPADFKENAARILLEVPGWNTPKRQEQVHSTQGLRRALFDFIAQFANWDVANDQDWIKPARELVKAAHGDETPLVVDPFAGGGSIPLEALRLGCEAFASDLNPVACLILKVMLEDIPRHGPELAEELRRVGGEIKKRAEKELAEFYPKDPDGATPIAYLWARTVRCESPNCGAEIPLVRSFWLCKKANRRWALRAVPSDPSVGSVGPGRSVRFEIFEPKSDKEVPEGTVGRARATCLYCGTVLPPERVRAQLAAQRGGADVVFDPSDPTDPSDLTDRRARIGGARLLAVVTLRPGEQGRHYRLPTERDYEAVWKAQQRLQAMLQEWEQSVGLDRSADGSDRSSHLCPVPDEPIHAADTRNFWVCKYGPQTFGDLFTARQKVALVTLVQLVRELTAEARSEAVREAMTLTASRCVDYSSSLCSWHLPGEKVNHTYGRQALPIVWDFCEVFPFSASTGNYDGALQWISKAIDAWPGSRAAQVQLADATEHPLPDETAQVWFTDPPYYDAIDYAHCSDFFFVWLKRTLAGHPLLHDPFDPKNPLTPKTREIVVDSTTTKGHGVRTPQFYEASMGSAFAEGRRVLREDGVGAVVFAHKTTEGWEALLSGMIRGGWTITGSWPIATEMASRLRARDSAALATSVHLVCRPRPADAPVGDWAAVLRELPKRVGDWMERLQAEGIRGADLVFACIGPALEIFSRYRRVETAEGQEVTLAEFLEKVWEVVGRTALENVLGTQEARARNGVAGALEEDARLTALFLWTLQSTVGDSFDQSDPSDPSDLTDLSDDDDHPTPKGGYALIFDVVRRFAQPLGINLPKWEGRIIETKKGVVRLLSVAERARILFGKDGAEAVAERLEKAPADIPQLLLFSENQQRGTRKQRRGRSDRSVGSDETLEASRDLPAEGSAQAGGTTLDRVHVAMLLQASGRANALRALLKTEQERGPNFLRLANALSALYPAGSEEKRLLDAMLLAVPR